MGFAGDNMNSEVLSVSSVSLSISERTENNMDNR